MPPKGSKATSPAAYAQAKRDAESTARNTLEILLSVSNTTKEYFSGIIARGNTTYNPTTKALKAATNYISDLKSERDELARERDALKDQLHPEQVDNRAPARRSDYSHHHHHNDNGKRVNNSKQTNQQSHAPITIQIAPPTIWNDTDIANLRQAATRCVAKAEEKMQCVAMATEAAPESGAATHVGEELTKVLRQGHDLLVDITDMIEQGGMSEEMKQKWKEEQEEWGRSFWLQR